MSQLSDEDAGQRLVLAADEANGRILRQVLSQVCGQCSVDPEVVGEFAVAVSEAFSNAVLHGTGRPHGTIEAWIRAEAGVCRVTLEYPGEPFPPDDPTLPDDVSTNGRGRFLMRSFADRVEYHFEGGLTRVEISRRFDRR